jgi:hypothetical protein
MFNRRLVIGLAVLTALTLNACTSVTIDEYRQGTSNLEDGDSVVLIGRRHSSDYETEPDLVSCIGDIIAGSNSNINVIGEREFMDKMYPWFEPRTAPMNMKRLDLLSEKMAVANAMDTYNVSYIIWIDGNTETTSSAGSIGCSIGAGGAGCFGFGTWDKESDYEATIWDYKNRETLGTVSAGATGTSYMPALVIPIPLIARVQANACKGMAAQLNSFLAPGQTSPQ